MVSSPNLRVNTSKLSQGALYLSDLDQVQDFTDNFIYHNDLAISHNQHEQLKSNSSRINSFLNLPIDLLFGQIAYADELPQSNDSSSSSSATTQSNGLFNIFKSAVSGDPNAQLEMRRRFPMGATFSDETNNSYRAWNEPILEFKKDVHNRLGASWFLPSSMDDLGQGCLNMATSATAVGAIPRFINFGMKVQFAYQAYRKTQAIANRPPSDRIQHEAAKILYRQNMQKPYIQDPKLTKVVGELYRPKAKMGSGSTADAARFEIATNQKVGNKWHLEKTSKTIKYLEDWLKKNTQATPGDRAAAENVLSDMKDAIGQKEWYSQTKPPKP